MSMIDLTKKFASVDNIDNMTLYVNSRMNLTKFEYLGILYIIDDYQMHEDCFLIICGENQYKIPVDLTLYNESLVEFRQTVNELDFDQDHSISIDMNSENLVMDEFTVIDLLSSNIHSIIDIMNIVDTEMFD